MLIIVVNDYIIIPSSDKWNDGNDLCVLFLKQYELTKPVSYLNIRIWLLKLDESMEIYNIYIKYTSQIDSLYFIHQNENIMR